MREFGEYAWIYPTVCSVLNGAYMRSAHATRICRTDGRPFITCSSVKKCMMAQGTSTTPRALFIVGPKHLCPLIREDEKLFLTSSIHNM